MTKAQRNRSTAAREYNYVRRIHSAWNSALPEHLDAGLAWYSRAEMEARSIHPNVLVGAGVLAALSPRTQWHENQRIARLICRAAIQQSSIIPQVSTYDRRGKAWAIATLENPTIDAILSILHGPKTQRFFRNIIGDTHAVTIDVWAKHIAIGAKEKGGAGNGARTFTSPRAGWEYDAMERAYQRVGSMVGVSARDVQAAVWVSVRGSAE